MNSVQPGSEGTTRYPLQEIENSAPHRLQLQLWEKEEEIVRQRVDRKENRRSSTQNEIYQLFGLYFVFQGVVLSALFQAAGNSGNSKHVCGLWWLPFSLSLISSLATIAAILYKLNAHAKLELQLEDEKKDSRALLYLIQKLRLEGAQFDLQEQPRSSAGNPRGSGKDRGILGHLLQSGLTAYTATVTLVLILFSGIILVSCKLLLCGRFIRT